MSKGGKRGTSTRHVCSSSPLAIAEIRFGELDRGDLQVFTGFTHQVGLEVG